MIKNVTLLILVSILIALKTKGQSAVDFTNFNSTNTSSFTTNNFKAIAVGKGGHVWAGTQYGGLYKYNPITKLWDKYSQLTNVFINDIKSDKDGGIWVAQSGQSGSVGGGSNIDGGINYFPSQFFTTMSFYSITTNGGLSSRNVRSLWVDSSRFNGASNPRVWAAQASFITSFNATRGGIGLGLNTSGNYFNKITNGIDPATNATPSILSVGGNKDEVWVMAQANYGRSQILRYHPAVSSGVFRGAYDNQNVPNNIFSAGFRANAIYFDKDGRQWIGLQAGGVIVKWNALWIKLNSPTLFPASVAINNNAITGDEEGNVYIGTSDGLVVFRGGDVSDETNFERYTTVNGLPSNNIAGIAVDTLKDQVLLATDGGVSFWKVNKKIKVKLAWDYSFPKIAEKPKGVAADGVARLYLKIKRGSDTIPKFKNVQVISNRYEAVDRSIRGRLKVAFALERYSEEASGFTFTNVERTDSTADGNFWFWYVAPEDFSVDNVGGNAEKSERRDDIKIKVTFTDDRVDSTLFSVMVVRPPLLMVHGLASGPSTWDNLYHGSTRFIESQLFKYKRALTMDGRGLFYQNAKRLLNGDYGNAEEKLNSIQGNIEEIRKLGYAANQVDYLCHSMGGIMIRGAQGWYREKFYANGNYLYNNYKKGFVHKLVFVNTPHNSSTIADAVTEYIPQLPFALKVILTDLNLTFPSWQMPFDFFAPEVTSGFSLSINKFEASPAVKNLAVSKRFGGINLPYTEGVKNHLIIGDVDMTSLTINSLLKEHKYVQRLSDLLLPVARDFAGASKGQLNAMLNENLTSIQRLILWWNFYSASKGYPSFTADGDLIVPLASETAKQAETSLHITKFLNTPGSVYDASHITILARRDVGKRILDLLNEPVNNNPLFADEVPPNIDAEPAVTDRQSGSSTNNNRTVTTFFDTSKIVFIRPFRTGDTTYVDSTLLLKFKVKDTAGLVYVQIHIQDTDSFRVNKNALQELPIKINPVFTGKQRIYAMAIYEKGDSVKYHVDSLSLFIKNLAPLQGFRILKEEVEVSNTIKYWPEYEVQFNNEWVRLVNSDTSIKIAFTPTSIVGYDSSTYFFKGLQTGFTQAYFTYKGYRDTLSFNSVLEAPKQNIIFNGKVLLQGTYNTANGNMNTTLNSAGILASKASSQPYGDTIFNYYGLEKVETGFFSANPTIVDWVQVELRDSELPTAVVTTRAAFVKQDGTLTDTSGANTISFGDVPLGSYYVVIKHRNHLAVRSSAVINFSSGTGTHDFTTSIASAFQGTVSNPPMATVAPGVYAMWGGNMNDDKQVKMTGFTAAINDYLKLLNVLGNSINTQSNVYSKQDVNMDGNVNMTGMSADNNDYLKLLNILGNSINQINQPAF